MTYVRILLAASVLCWASSQAQQFNSDNQWTAPHGVGTGILTIGEDFSAAIAVAALVPDWEFNVGITHYYRDSDALSDGHDTGSFYVKHRVFENEDESGGLAWAAGSGVDPSHLEEGVVTDTFKSWWGNLIYTMPFRDGRVTWDLLPGVLYNRDLDNTANAAWGFTYSSRVAVYDVIPQSAIVAEVFGTTGEAESDPRYRIGVRWESEKLIVAASFSEAFNHSGGAGFEIGFMYLTDPRFCFGGCNN